jgi:hypothetical protein
LLCRDSDDRKDKKRTIATFDGGTSQGGGSGDGMTQTMPGTRTATVGCNVVGRGELGLFSLSGSLLTLE